MRHAEAPPRKQTVLFWTAAILTFLLLSVAASLRADSDLPAKASRTANWNASGEVRSISVENINGEVKVVAGTSVTATVEITAHGRTEAQAKKALERTKTLFANEDGEVSLAIEPPGATVRRHGRHGWSIHSDDHEAWSVSARWTVTAPANVAIEVSTVNGAVATEGMTGDLKLSSVNGRVAFTGARGNLDVDTVNGAVDGTLAALPASATVKAEAVNGNVTLRLPKNASFHLSAHTMSGEILSTFPLPAARVDDELAVQRDRMRAEKEKVRAEKEKMRAEREKRRTRPGDEGEGSFEIDMSELDRAMAELDREMADLSRNLSRSIVANLNRGYEGTVGSGGARLKLSNLNGRILVLAEGTREADAKPLVGARGRVVTVPHPVPPAPPAVGAPVPPVPPRITVRIPKIPSVPVLVGDEEEGSVVQGDVQGDFLTTLPSGDVQVGKVSGKVRISTHAGQIKVGRAGAGAELKSLGGDVSIGSVAGDLKATTLGGNVEAGSVSGNARLETQGGDVVLRSCDGSVTVHTGAGDVTLGKVKGGVHASTSGGSIVCELASAQPKDSELSTSGGDVTLTLPANARADVEVVVHGADPDRRPIVSDFPELTVEQGRARAAAGGKLNGGGARVTVSCTSGTVRVKKGPVV